MNWRDSDPSDDEVNRDTAPPGRKRSSRACDLCRKTKSKCDRALSGPCKSCAFAGTECTFLGPSYKRGPPKGYIHAIEQRWHQVESLLGAIIQCPDARVQSIVSDMRKDELAREIIRRVDIGPFGPSGRQNQPAGTTKEDLFASILRANASECDPSRSGRQSRVSREIVSFSQDQGLSVVPTLEWQDSLSNRLASSASSSYHSNGMTFDSSGVPLVQRRRLDVSPTDTSTQPDWNDMYTMTAVDESDEYNPHKDPAEGIGQLSLDENKEVRFHGKASGLHLLGRSDRIDDRNEGGIWKFPMARVWPGFKDGIQHSSDEFADVQLPPVHVQDRLIELYFTHIHPVFPVIHKARFMKEYNDRKSSPELNKTNTNSSYSSFLRPEPSQKISKLLLLSMFAIASRFSEEEAPPPPKGKLWEAGCNYLDSALRILTKLFHSSRPSTVQSLLLLGYREFGMGSMEQGWIYVGMAIRMAIDLGLNCNLENWKIHGTDLFAADETQTRRQIWWMCCIADRFGSVYMGRPIFIREGDFDTPLPDINQDEENELWSPLPSDPMKINYPPVPGRVMSSFCSSATLAVLVGEIVTRVYPVRSTPGVSRRAMLADLESRLDQWYITLPENLCYDASMATIPPPHILSLHIRYWGAVLLLNRAFIPNWKGIELDLHNSTLELKAFDLAQGAANHVTAIVTAYSENFTLKRSSPFLTPYILGAGIIHILSITLRPSSIQATIGLRQCMTALKEMAVIWPSASRGWDLLNGVKVGFDKFATPVVPTPTRNKRRAEDDVGRVSDFLQHETFGVFEGAQLGSQNSNGVQDISARIMAHMLGLDIPGIEPSASYYPSYELWPRRHQGHSRTPPAQQPLPPSNSVNMAPTVLNGGVAYNAPPVMGEWPRGTSSEPPSYPYNFNHYSGV